MGTQKKYSPEVRERAVRMVLKHEHSSRWAVIGSVSGNIGGTAQMPRSWIYRAERDSGLRAGLTSSEAERLKVLEQENRDLQRANEILRKASAFFAQAERNRRAK